MRGYQIIVVGLMFWLGIWPAWAAEGCKLAADAVGTVARVASARTIVLEDGRRLRLTGARPVSTRKGRRDKGILRRYQALTTAATQKLEKLLVGQRVFLAQGKRRKDRYGRLLGQLFVQRRQKRLWVQGVLVADGLARATSWRDNRLCIAALLRLERLARKAKRGLWRLRSFAPQAATPPRRLYRLVQTFQLIEGEVRKVARIRGRVYLNFGDNYRRDFTIVIAPKHRRLFEREGMDLEGLKGQRLRVRGWLDSYNGPLIRATHPEQIEILSSPLGPMSEAVPHVDRKLVHSDGP